MLLFIVFICSDIGSFIFISGVVLFIIYLFCHILNRKSTYNSTNNEPQVYITEFISSNSHVKFDEPVSYTSYSKFGLSYTSYLIKAKYIKTNRMRKIEREYHNSYSETDIIQFLKDEGYVEPFTITVNTAYNEPTEAQIKYAKDLNIPIYPGLGKYDISCLIDRVLEHCGSPNQGLIDFADEEKLFFSYCIGKKQMYDIVFAQLDTRTAIAFFIFSVYRFLYNDREANLNKSPHRNLFFSFGDKYVDNNKFVKSMYDNYKGSDLRYFGSINIKDSDGMATTIYGGSNRTYSYQEAKKYLIEHFGKFKRRI